MSKKKLYLCINSLVIVIYVWTNVEYYINISILRNKNEPFSTKKLFVNFCDFNELCQNMNFKWFLKKIMPI